MSNRTASIRLGRALVLALLAGGSPACRHDPPVRLAVAGPCPPAGGIFLFGAYSAKLGAGAGGGFIRDVAADSFTLGGLSYADGDKYEAEVRECIARGLKIAFRLCPLRTDGSRISTKNGEVSRAGSEQIDVWVEQIRQQVAAALGDPGLNGHIVAWYLMPEELRPWHPQEKALLQRMYDAVQALDPLRRPAWMYNPQRTTAARLLEMASWLDIFSMGIYPRRANNIHNRLQVRYALEQMKLANSRLEKPRPLLPVLEMFESSAYPGSSEDAALVESFVRHDAYCAIANGADGILVWSMGRRAGFSAYSDYYAAWAGISRETRELGLRDVISRGVPLDAVALSVVTGPVRVPFVWGTVSESYPPLSSRAWECDGRIYVVVVNSAEEEVGFTLRDATRRGIPGYRNLLTGEAYRLAGLSLRFSLPPRGVLLMASAE